MKKIIIFLLPALLVGCGEDHKGSSAPQTKTSQPEAPTQNETENNAPPKKKKLKTIAKAKVCYPKICYRTIPKSKLRSRKKNWYRYPKVSHHKYQPPKRFIDLKRTSANQKLSPHFRLGEFMQEWKGRYALYSPKVVNILEKIRSRMGKTMKIVSGYRAPGYNRGLKGAARTSRHMFGDAVDISISSGSLKKIRRLCLQYGASFTQLYRGHIHCDWRSKPFNKGFYPTHQHDPFIKEEDVLFKMQAESGIQHVREQDDVIFSVYHPSPDDSGLLHYEWTIQRPDGSSVALDDSDQKVRLPFSSGTYLVQVNVGGSLIVKREVHL